MSENSWKTLYFLPPQLIDLIFYVFNQELYESTSLTGKFGMDLVLILWAFQVQRIGSFFLGSAENPRNFKT
jgi:hypothetical protein